MFIGPPGLRTYTCCSVTDVRKWIHVVMFALWRCRVSSQRPTVLPDVVMKPGVYKGGPVVSRGAWRVRCTWGQRVAATGPDLGSRQVFLKLHFAWKLAKLASSARSICDPCSWIIVQRCQSLLRMMDLQIPLISRSLDFNTSSSASVFLERRRRR